MASRTPEQQKADYEAMVELASDMRWSDAARFIRSESCIGLRESIYVVERIAHQHPQSVCGQSFNARNPA